MSDENEVLNNIFNKKVALRSFIKKELLKSYDSKFLGYKISEQLKLVIPKGTTVAAFLALQDEPSLDVFFTNSSYKFCLPRIENKDLQFYFINGGQKLIKNSLGILEPDAAHAERIGTEKIDVMIIPGLGYDRKFQRLGRGKGFYDRVLKNYKGLKIGITSAAQVLSDDIPCESHDVPMDLIVCEKFILKRFDA